MQLLHWAKTNLYLSVPLLVIVLFVVRELLLSKLKNYYFLYYTVLFPGVVLHEASHLLGCLITGAKISDVEFFSTKGGHVMHSKPRLKYIGTFIISFFPLFIGIFAVISLAPILLASTTTLSGIVLKIFIFYLLTAVLITMFPSSKDFSNAALPYILILGFSLFSAYFLRGWINFGDRVIVFLLFCIVILCLATITLFLAEFMNKKDKSLNNKRRRL